MLGAVLGTGQVCEAFAAAGRAARVVAPDDVGWLPGGWLTPDRDLIEVRGSPIAIVSLRLSGVVGPRRMLAAGAFSLRIGGLPIARRDVVPVKLHFLARLPDVGPGHAAELVQLGRGWLSTRPRDGIGWRGPLARALSADGPLLLALDAELGDDDGLRIVPDAAAGAVRIVLARTLVTHLGLAAGADLARVDRPPLSPALIHAIERIAEITAQAVARG